MKESSNLYISVVFYFLFFFDICYCFCSLCVAVLFVSAGKNCNNQCWKCNSGIRAEVDGRGSLVKKSEIKVEEQEETVRRKTVLKKEHRFKKYVKHQSGYRKVEWEE